MPSLPKHACSTPGCGKPVTYGSRCSTCQRSHHQRIDARRESPYRRGYDKQHLRLRIICFQRDGWTCVDCGWQPDIVRDFKLYDLGDPPLDAILEELRQRNRQGEKHLHGEHDVPIERQPDLKHDIDNYKTRCNECHSKKTLRELMHQ